MHQFVIAKVISHQEKIYKVHLHLLMSLDHE